jgi:cytochrome c-type biogenesis protein CcmH/NrfG
LLPNDTDAWLRSGKLRLKQGDPTGAARDFEAARKLGSNDPDLLRLLSETYKSQGRTEDERQLLDSLISQGAASSAQYARRSELRQDKDPAGALSDLRKSLDLSKDDADLRLRLAAMTAASGDLSTAIGLYRAVVASKPEAKPALAALEERAGLAKKPLKGNIAQINAGLSSELNRAYHLLLKKQPGLAGSLKLRVSVNEKGAAEDEEWLDDTLKSPELAANLRWNAHDASYPAQAARYVLKFSLAP